jgi:3-oxoacyl-[acyl-carrier-protein] synthase III
MRILEIENDNFANNKKLDKKYINFIKLVEEMNKHEIPDEVIEEINTEIEKMNTFSGKDKKFLKVFVKSQLKILKKLEAKLGLVPKKHYQNTWMVVGIAIGISIGVAIGSTTNMGMMAIGLPIGLGVGIHLGKKKDDEALKQGKQLDVEI